MALDQSLLNRLPTGTAGFEKIRREKIYVDKTELIYQLAIQCDEFFIARPRRFGKSLLVNTLEHLFKKGLADFQGLAIEKLWTDTTYPVVKLDFSGVKRYATGEAFSQTLNSLLLEGFWSVGFRYDESRKTSLIDQLKTWMAALPPTSLVILIDEYDAPLVNHLNDEAVFKDIRLILAEFYAALKSCENCLRFFFMTGITKFLNTGIFSELNNLTDLTYSLEYAELFGLTDAEITKYFSLYVENAAGVLGTTPEEVRKALRRHYDGYTFEKTCSKHVYAPWSVLNFLKHAKDGYENYWYSSSSQPEVLDQYLMSHRMVTADYYSEPKAVAFSVLTASQEYVNMQREAILTQSGYLTLKTVYPNGICLLGYPNEEVAQSMAQLCAGGVLKAPLVFAEMSELPNCLEFEGIDKVVYYFNKAFANITYQNYPVTSEAACAMGVQVLLIGAAMIPAVEVQNAYGRSDLEVKVGNRLWVMEFKFLPKEAAQPEKEAQRLLEDGLQQLKERHYGEQHLEKAELKKAALVFSEEKRQFITWAEC